MLLRFLIRSPAATVAATAGMAVATVAFFPSSLLPNRQFASESKGKKSTTTSSCAHHRLPISAPFCVFSSRYFSSGSRDEKGGNFGTEPLPGFELSEGSVLPMKSRVDEEGIYVDIDVRRFSKVEITASEMNSVYGMVTVRAENESETQTQLLGYAHNQDTGVYVQTEKTTATKKNGVLSLTIPKVKK